ncbi:MAG TPA: NnrS family protein [Leptospiraceae bacterium]|nr:NnrS family protein [Leptospiraceae bacterium]HMW06367.1 NnrS family protein [Leptospiraceae bacterium]HMX31721.1 NnrS family protein [Leptospiraceae bacterium]HMY32007.1 NnrS family protein [Leptospiraceae bacterium]HMZ65780.1 NnrS family protein [Leptospiraceae bacterium]
MSLFKNKQLDPYRFFFPISILGGITGVSLWLLFWVAQTNTISSFKNIYPLKLHITIMTVFFLLPVIKGFVFTAIPRFTGTSLLNQSELLILTSIQLILITILLFYNDSLIFYTFQSIDFGFLFLFILHRFKISKLKLSSYLYFLTGGFFLGIIGSIAQLTSVYLNQYYLFLIGKDFIFYGMVPCIIFGTGTRIIPMIVNSENPSKRMEWMARAEGQKWNHLVLVIFILSYLIEFIAVFYLDLGILFKGLRFLICVYWIVTFFHILEIKSFQTKLPRLILVACYLFIIGLAGHTFGFKYSAHLAHFYLAGGLTLLILGIMTRVTLSHGGADMRIEKNSNVFYWIIAVILSASIARSFAYISMETMTSHFAYAAILFTLGLLFWSVKIGRFILK